MVVTEAAAALPVDGFGDAAFVCAVDDFLEAGMMWVWQCSPSSICIQRRPILWATAPVVPEPAKESRVISPGLFASSRIR
jgi:hypothetical protein